MWTAPWFVLHDAIKGSADGRDTLLSESMCCDNALIHSMALSLVDSHSGDIGAVTLGEIASEFGREAGVSPVFFEKALSSGGRFVDLSLDVLRVCACE
jgi:hypothetical protein